ncbi:MAG TPA: rhodanese-like domain-containing protein [Gemmatimonadota bacterium]|nr:rhodanese-like domain-containing protein [Gemmatimonadota bacterium]
MIRAPSARAIALAAALLMTACGEGDDGRAAGERADSSGASDVVADTQLVVDSMGQQFLVITTRRPRVSAVEPRAGAGDPDRPGAVQPVDPATAAERMSATPVPWYVIDVRTPEEYVSDGHLEGAALVPLDQLEANVADLQVRTDQMVLVYSGGDGRALQAARLLAGYGFPTVRVLEGGLPAWRAAGLPVEERP